MPDVNKVADVTVLHHAQRSSANVRRGKRKGDYLTVFYGRP